MNLLWTKHARSHLQAIYEYIEPENHSAALRQVHSIKDAVENLSLFPNTGRIGRVAGTRELVNSRTEFIVAYINQGTSVLILAIRHSAQRWPRRFST